jgi:NADPH-dependent 7-cyano-7-deazaguanine reductase QueF
MLTEAITFDRFEIGQLVMRLQGFCRHCANYDDCNPFTSGCPVGIARDLLSQYLKDQQQVVKEFPLEQIPSYQFLHASHNELIKEIFELIPPLCKRCMFHVERCFMNVVYALLEMAVFGQNVKPLTRRPGDTVQQ